MFRDDVEPPIDAVRDAVRRAIDEDLFPLGDITAGLIPGDIRASATFVARQDGVLAGGACAQEACEQIDPQLSCEFSIHDGQEIVEGQVLATVQGPLRAMVTAERTALNFLCHLSGVATLTRRFVDVVAGINEHTQIWDTRKTTPGLRSLEKAAVRAGGGANHRGNLSEAIMIKDNHLGHLGISDAVKLARRRWPGRMVEVECDHLDQITPAIEAGATIVLLDNMSPDEVKKAMEMVQAISRGSLRAVLVEASGGISLANVADYAATGVDLISVGALTHSAPILDIGLDL